MGTASTYKKEGEQEETSRVLFFSIFLCVYMSSYLSNILSACILLLSVLFPIPTFYLFSPLLVFFAFIAFCLSHFLSIHSSPRSKHTKARKWVIFSLHCFPRLLYVLTNSVLYYKTASLSQNNTALLPAHHLNFSLLFYSFSASSSSLKKTKQLDKRWSRL